MTSLEYGKVWTGSATRRVPDEARIQAIGKRLGLDAVVMAWIRSEMAGTTVELYVIEVDTEKTYQRAGRKSQMSALLLGAFEQVKRYER